MPTTHDTGKEASKEVNCVIQDTKVSKIKGLIRSDSASMQMSFRSILRSMIGNIKETFLCRKSKFYKIQDMSIQLKDVACNVAKSYKPSLCQMVHMLILSIHTIELQYRF